MKENTMNTINQILKDIILNNKRNFGYCPLPKVMTELKRMGYDKSLLGPKASDYFEQSPWFELGENRNEVRINRAYLKNNQHITPAKQNTLQNTDMCITDNDHSTSCQIPVPTPAKEKQLCLETFANIDNDKKLQIVLTLNSMIDVEDWHDSKNTLWPLWNYLDSQFKASWNEHKVLINDRMAVFNTGLYKQHNTVFMTMERNGKTFSFKGLVLGNTTTAKNVMSEFGKMPERATYGNREDRLFDEKAFDMNAVDHEHIAKRIARFPIAFVSMVAPTGFELKDMTYASKLEKEEYGEKFARMKNEDARSAKAFRHMMDGAIRDTLKAVEENPMEAVFAYNCNRATVEHLLPLCMVDPNVVDLALVVTQKDGHYLAHTVLTLEQARNDARTVGRINNSWLK